MLQADNAVLVVVDVQGKLATLMHEKEAFFANVVRMIKGAQALDIPILWNEQLPDKLGDTIPEIAQALSGQSPLAKKTFSCCGNDSFVGQLEDMDRRQVLLVGMETHVCVYQTALDLLNDDYDVYLVADAVSSRSLENKNIGVQAIRDAGANLTCVEMSLFEMLKVAQGDQFKQIINIVK
ncbi:MAG: hydrolase [candidate division Zixibacteria bacterium]|nr:hydrolase [candidate division Zixibacteria bacterium]